MTCNFHLLMKGSALISFLQHRHSRWLINQNGQSEKLLAKIITTADKYPFDKVTYVNVSRVSAYVWHSVLVFNHLFHMSKIICRYLKLKFKYLKLNFRYLNTNCRYLELNFKYQIIFNYLKSNFRYQQIQFQITKKAWFIDIWNWISDI